jgi:hypothetical protein
MGRRTPCVVGVREARRGDAVTPDEADDICANIRDFAEALMIAGYEYKLVELALKLWQGRLGGQEVPTR